MRIKKEYFVLGAIIVALSVYLLARNSNRTQYDLPEISEIPPSEISKIEIARPDGNILLQKRDGQWLLLPEEYKADKSRVENMVGVIQSLRLTALVSSSGNTGLYDLDEGHKIAVKAWQGEKLAREFDIGKAAGSFQHTFVKLSGDERVYHAMGSFRGDFDQSAEALRDKTVLSFDRKSIQEIHLAGGQKTLTLVRTEVPAEAKTGDEGKDGGQGEQMEATWKTPEGKAGKKDEVERLLNTLSSLRCEKYVDGKKKEDFAEPLYTVRLKGAQEYSLSLFAKATKEDNSTPAVSSENPHPFFLPDWQIKNIEKDAAEYLEKAEEKQPAAKAKKP
jgi:Domain of unknown function (DUF4340)